MNLDASLGIVSRGPLRELTAAFSGAVLEEGVLADGRRVILKHLPPDGDWLTRATGGAGRLRALWDSGLLGRVRPVVDHTILEMLRNNTADVAVMRDARDDLLPAMVPISRETSRALLRGLGAMHDEFVDYPVSDLCSVGARYAMFAPRLHSNDDEPGAHPSAKMIRSGWDVFANNVERSIVDTVFAIHADPAVLQGPMARFPPTLLHGDAKLENLGLGREGIVAVDWGDLTGFGPREVDVAWYALKGSDRIGCTPDEIFADYEAVSGRLLDPEALDLACIGSLAQMGFLFASHAFASRGGHSELARSQLAWWIERVESARRRVGSLR